MSVDALQGKIRKLKSPVALALDLRPALVPPALLESRGDPAAACLAYGAAVLETLAGTAPAVKCNTAYYYAMGAAGVETLQKLTALARELGYYVILETARSDLEEAAELAAAACFGPVFGADAVCLCAFTGSDGVRPYLPYCRDGGKALFLLARTPNKSAREVQDLISGDRVIHTVITDLAVRWGGELVGPSGYAQVGVLAAANRPAELERLRRQYDRLFVLAAGYGLPGGGAKDVRFAFDRFGHGAAAVPAGGILDAWKKREDGDYAAAVLAAAEKVRRDIAGHVTVMG